jgi:hypothetical protein
MENQENIRLMVTILLANYLTIRMERNWSVDESLGRLFGLVDSQSMVRLLSR